MGGVQHASGTGDGRARKTPAGALLQMALALAGTATVLAIHWQNHRKPIHSILVGWYAPLYYPLLNLVLFLCVAALVKRSLEVGRWVRRRSSTRGAGSTQLEVHARADTTGPGGSHVGGSLRTRLGEAVRRPTLRQQMVLDGVMVLLLTGVALILLDAFRRKANPTSACVGSDYVTFLSNIVSVGLERWTIYNPAKRLPYPWISATLARLSGRSFLEAGQLVSLVSVSLIPGTTYLAAIPAVGRFNGVIAALLVLAIPLLHPFAMYTGSYGLFAFSVTAVLAAGTWAAAKGGVLRFLLLGVVSALCVQIQTKGIVPVALIGTSTLVLSGHCRQRLVHAVAIVVPLALSTALTPLLPVTYPSLGAMTAINRQEVHRDMPYRWPNPGKPNLKYPSPISRYLPGFMRGGELESFAAVVLAPPDTDIVRVGRHREGDRWVVDADVIPETSIPPLAVRLRGNLRVLADMFPGIFLVLALLVLLGVVGLFFPRGENARARRAAGLVIAAAIAPLWGPLSLNLHTRYVIIVLPPATIAAVSGVSWLVRGWMGGRHPLMRGLESVLIAWFCASLGISLFTRTPNLWLKPSLDLSSLPRYLGVADQESHVSRSVAAQRIAAWVTTNTPPHAKVYDCTALGIYLLHPKDRRWVNAFQEGTVRDAHCRNLALAGAPGDPTDTYLIASNSSEFRGPDTLSIESLVDRQQHWELAFGIGMDSLAPLTPSTQTIEEDVILVFRGTEAHETPARPGDDPSRSAGGDSQPPRPSDTE